MQHYHVSLSWKTDAGTIGTAGLMVVALSSTMAATLAAGRIKRDRRRRYSGGMNTSASAILT